MACGGFPLASEKAQSPEGTGPPDAACATRWGRIPPWRTYSRSRGVSSRRVARNSRSSARTVTSRASPFSTPVIENTSRHPSARATRVSPPGGTGAGGSPSSGGSSGGSARSWRRSPPSLRGVRPLRGPVARRARAVLFRRSRSWARPRRGTARRPRDRRLFPDRRWTVRSSDSGTRRFRMPTLANVPRTITSWFLRREP